MALIEMNNSGVGTWFFSPEGEKEIGAAMAFAKLAGNNEPAVCETCGNTIKIEPALLSIRVDNPRGRVAIRTGYLCVTCPKCGKRTTFPGMMTMEAYPTIVKILTAAKTIGTVSMDGYPPIVETRDGGIVPPQSRRLDPRNAELAIFRNNPYYREEAK